jgi:hypothetical protein
VFEFGSDQAQKRIAAVEVVGIRDAVVIYRDRDGRVLFSTDPVANVTVVAKNVVLPEVTIRETSQSTVDRMPVEGVRNPRQKPMVAHGCEPAVSADVTPSLSAVASRCLARLGIRSDFAALP